MTLAASSQEERSKLDYQATVAYGYDHKVTGTQVKFSKFLDQDSLIGLKGGEGTHDGNEEEDTQTVFGLEYKYFTGNSFYLAPEIYYLNYSENDKTPTLFDNENETVKTVGLSFKIGNQWQWSNFTMGVDWIGIGRNLFFFQRTDDLLTHNFTATFLNAYIGISF